MKTRQVLTLLLPVGIAASFCTPGPGWHLAFEDTFSGTALNQSNWNVLNGTDSGSCRAALCTPEAVTVSGGSLVLTTANRSAEFNGEVFNWTTGAVNSKGKQHWDRNQTFRLCVTAKLPGGGPDGDGNDYVGTGIWPAAWMMPDDMSCWPVRKLLDAPGCGCAVRGTCGSQRHAP